ncbi:MAG: LytTR family DNA-binding domain-containing protein [Bacteroidia bacterium]|nr:LytTR family DNA-binding domain-containing protein [Bacteroidia bacterium]
MKALVLEDEFHAAQFLKKSLMQLGMGVEVLACLESVEDAVQWFSSNPMPDVVFMDIHLADDLSFEVFNKVNVTAPVIFTTAYDQYAIRAFKCNGFDYLLKPIQIMDLEKALQKVIHYSLTPTLRMEEIALLIAGSKEKKVFRERFLIPVGDQLKLITSKELSWIESKSGITTLATKDGKKLIIDFTLDQLEDELNPAHFFRINRSLLVGLDSIQKINQWFTRRYKLEVNPPPDGEVIVSRERVSDFNKWLEGKLA